MFAGRETNYFYHLSRSVLGGYSGGISAWRLNSSARFFSSEDLFHSCPQTMNSAPRKRHTIYLWT